MAEVACRLPSLTSLELHNLIARGDTGLAPLAVFSKLQRLVFNHQGVVLGALGDVLPRLTELQVGGYGADETPSSIAGGRIFSENSDTHIAWLHACVHASYATWPT